MQPSGPLHGETEPKRSKTSLAAWYLIALAVASPLVVIPFGQDLQLGAVDLWLDRVRTRAPSARNPLPDPSGPLRRLRRDFVRKRNAGAEHRIGVPCGPVVADLRSVPRVHGLRTQRHDVVEGAAGVGARWWRRNLFAFSMYFFEIDAPGLNRSCSSGVCWARSPGEPARRETGPLSHLAARGRALPFWSAAGSEVRAVDRLPRCGAGPAAILLPRYAGGGELCDGRRRYVLTRPFTDVRNVGVGERPRS